MKKINEEKNLQKTEEEKKLALEEIKSFARNGSIDMDYNMSSKNVSRTKSYLLSKTP